MDIENVNYVNHHYVKSSVIAMDGQVLKAQIDLLMELVEKNYCVDMDKKTVSIAIAFINSNGENNEVYYSEDFIDFSELRLHMTNYLRHLAFKLSKSLPYKVKFNEDDTKTISYDFDYMVDDNSPIIKCQYSGRKDWGTERPCDGAPHGVAVDSYCTNCNDAKKHICQYGLIVMKPGLTKEEMESKAEEDCAKIFNFKGGLKSKLTKDLLSKDDDDTPKRYRMLDTKNRDIVRTLINRLYDLQKL